MARVEFDEVRFPEDVSYGSSGGPTFKTSIFEAYRGGEKRNIDWASPLMEFDVSYGIKTDDQMARVIAFFNARQGKLRGFRYKNWANYQIINDNIAIGDGVSTRLPMIRTYGFPATQTYKRLYKIVQGSVTGVTVGPETLTEGIDFSIDYNSGEIIFSSDRAPGEGIPVKAATLEFDEPVRFDTDNLTAVIEGFNNSSVSALPLVGIRDNFTYGTVPAPDAATLTRYTANDSFYGSTRLLLKFDDIADPSTTVDESRYNETVTITAPATLRSDTQAAGEGSVTFGATGYVSVSGTRFDLSNPQVPFTVETFIRRPVGLVGETQQLIFGKWVESGNLRGYGLMYQPSEQRLLYLTSVDGAAETITMNYPWTEGEDNTWQHISLDRLTSGLHVLRINGNVVQTALDPGAVFNPATTLNIGGYTTPEVGQGSFQGDIDSFRFTYARNRYTGTSKITPPQADYPT